MEDILTLTIWHRDYNLEKKDNLDQLPRCQAVFGIFAIVDKLPVNCRDVGETANLSGTIKALFEGSQAEGLMKFMQGPWIKILQYKLMPGSSGEERQKIAEEWRIQYRPTIDDEGEYPGYY